MQLPFTKTWHVPEAPVKMTAPRKSSSCCRALIWDLETEYHDLVTSGKQANMADYGA